MKAYRLHNPKSVDRSPLVREDIPKPPPGPGQLLLRVNACGICHTDLHIVEGELALPKLPLTPGHQIVAVVEDIGDRVTGFEKGERVGVPWLHTSCGECGFCKAGKDNLCDNALFTGYHLDGGYAEYVVVHERSAYHLPEMFTDVQAAPLLCAGVIGYRALRRSEIQPGQRMGLYGFGASAHIAIQVLKYWGCGVYVFTRGDKHRDLAVLLGADWTGTASMKPPGKIDSAIIFAPAGELVSASLKALNKGGTIALAGIHMSPIPELEYKLIYDERTIRSVANSTTKDVREFLQLAETIQIKTEVETFPLDEANQALWKLKKSEVRGSGVLIPY